MIIVIYSRGDIREVEFRLDKEGKEFHHFEEFAKMYRAEVGLSMISFIMMKGFMRKLFR